MASNQNVPIENEDAIIELMTDIIEDYTPIEEKAALDLVYHDVRQVRVSVV